ncbi:hypothetical protein RA178_06170 [Shewanella oncorhynchi]|uniref:Uncharacterized protein n=1 Tax=Shewanella oncorhynchi TaxID=2726434 RepID=A0AA50Q6U6_9GAMM|nr:hypothetical protein [Shewanella oncorhynchi]WMB74197.1 hypothetical protein RA178_06170 [Shewanella oncorhynchi]
MKKKLLLVGLLVATPFSVIADKQKDTINKYATWAEVCRQKGYITEETFLISKAYLIGRASAIQSGVKWDFTEGRKERYIDFLKSSEEEIKEICGYHTESMNIIKEWILE